MTMLQALGEVLRRRRREGWSVGGTVRDRLLGRPSPDVDVVVADDPAAVAEELAHALDSTWFALSARHGAYRVVGPTGRIDVARMRGAGILADLALRDFTMNAMAVPLGDEEEIIDPFEGRRHLDARILVGVSDHIFRDDPLRLMRAVRFCHVLGMTMDPALRSLLRAQSGMVIGSAPERVVAELASTLMTGGAGPAVNALAESGLLRAFLPEADVAGSPRVLDALDLLLDDVSHGDAGWARLRDRLDERVDGTFNRPAALRLAAVLRHVGPDSVAGLAGRLKLSGAMSSLLHAVSTWYGRVSGAGMTAGEGLVMAAGSARAATIFLWDTAPWQPEVILVATADSGATLRPALKPTAAGAGAGAGAVTLDLSPQVLLQRWDTRAANPVAPPFDGRVLMEALGLEQGPQLGRMLNEALLAWESGEISDVDGALGIARAAMARPAGS